MCSSCPYPFSYSTHLSFPRGSEDPQEQLPPSHGCVASYSPSHPKVIYSSVCILSNQATILWKDCLSFISVWPYNFKPSCWCVLIFSICANRCCLFWMICQGSPVAGACCRSQSCCCSVHWAPALGGTPSEPLHLPGSGGWGCRTCSLQ